MIRFRIDRIIDRPIGEVFDRIADIDSYREWMPRDGLFRASATRTGAPVAAGTEFVDEASFGRLDGRVTEFERPEKISFHQVLRRRGRPAFESRPAYVLEPADGGSRTIVHHLAEAELHGFLRIFRPIVGLVARRERRRVVDALTDSLEAGGG